MKNLSTLVLLVACTLAAAGQERLGVQATDTGSTRRIVILDPGITLGRPTILLPPPVEMASRLRLPSSSIFDVTPAFSSAFLGGVLDEKVDLTSPLRLQMKREADLQPFHTILGTIQAAGTAYIAYRHIKKYGFLK